MRAFPETKSCLRVFYDQLSVSEPKDPNISFFASNPYVAGVQKMPATWLQKARLLRPDLLHLHYALCWWCDPSHKNLVGDTWIYEDGDVITQHPEWMLKGGEPPAPVRLRAAAKAYMMNIFFADVDTTTATPMTGWPEYRLNQVLADMVVNDCDGWFADSATADLLINNVNPRPAYLQNMAAVLKDFQPHLEELFRFYTAGFLGKGVFLPNLASMNNHAYAVDYSNWATDGGMCEGFGGVINANHPIVWPSIANWRRMMDCLLALGAKSKIVICQQNEIGPNTPDNPHYSQNINFLVGCYLLTKGPRSYINLRQGFQCNWFAAYDAAISLGSYIADPYTDVSLYYNGICYERQYQNGTVYVNPFPVSVTVNLPATRNLFQAVNPGGPIVHGASVGSFVVAPVNTVTLSPYSAAIVRN